jgi:hypothetical protein
LVVKTFLITTFHEPCDGWNIVHRLFSTNYIEAPYWLASHSCFHPFTASLPTYCQNSLTLKMETARTAKILEKPQHFTTPRLERWSHILIFNSCNLINCS